MVGLGIGSITRELRNQMKGFSLTEALIILAIVAVSYVVFTSAVHTKYDCINGIEMMSYDGNYWKQSSSLPRYCLANKGERQ